MRIEKVFFWIFFVALAGTALGQHRLTLNLTGMDPHVGQFFQVRVIDKASGEEVGRKTIGSIPGAAFQVDLLVIMEGHSYNIDFYADFSIPGVIEDIRLSVLSTSGRQVRTCRQLC